MLSSPSKSSPKSGFTLIEMSIVLVIIGLVIGGIVTGQDLIHAAAIRAQIAQIDKFQTAVGTFQGKYGYLPGDIPDPTASRFGFQPRGTNPGQGDGNGLLQGYESWSGATGSFGGAGELIALWVDLSTAGLIDSHIIGNGGGHMPSCDACANWGTEGLSNWLPAAKIGSSNLNFIGAFSLYGVNYFQLSSVTAVITDIQSIPNQGLTVQQAYNIDKKIDDGLPQSGNVTTCYQNYGSMMVYAAGGSYNEGAYDYTSSTTLSDGTEDDCFPTTAATPPDSTTCYDNNNVVGVQKYSISQNANQPNCALSFRMQ